MDVVFTVNAGSSSLKCAGYSLPGLERVYSAHAGALGTERASIAIDGLEDAPVAPPTQARALDLALTGLRRLLPAARVVACSHRIVHGGVDFAAPVEIDEAMRWKLEALVPLAPLHQPFNLAGVAAMSAAEPAAMQVACFDTAFHRGHPKVAEVYALPRAVAAAGVRRYGFHGLSYEYIAEALKREDPALATGEVVVAHLGSGASLCAMQGGASVDSTMGFTALDGLPMSTRTGRLDPGVVIHLLREGRSLDEIEDMFYRESGLKGLSGLSGDMRLLLASDAPEAAFAVDYFCHHVAREIGAMAVSLDGLDGIVFTAGVGENQPEIRRNISARLGALGVRVDEAANAAGRTRFEATDSKAKLLRIPTDEEQMLARHAARLLA